MAVKEFNALLQVLSGEQQIIQRSDQKAFTLLSILGVFMVFFIVHFTKMQLDTLIFILIVIYFPAAMCALYFLVRVIVPRIRSHQNMSGADNTINFFSQKVFSLLAFPVFLYFGKIPLTVLRFGRNFCSSCAFLVMVWYFTFLTI